MGWKFEGKRASFTVTLFCLWIYLDMKKPSEHFASGELEHIPPDVKSNYLKPHELNKELPKLPRTPRLHTGPLVSLHLPLLLYTVESEQKVARVSSLRNVACIHVSEAQDAAQQMHNWTLIKVLSITAGPVLVAITWKCAVPFSKWCFLPSLSTFVYNIYWFIL